MAIGKSKSVCTECRIYACGNCRIGVALADNLITREQAQTFAREGDITMTKSVAGRLNAPSAREPDATTHELNVYGEIIKAGESFWESNKHPEKRGTVLDIEAIPAIPPDLMASYLQSMKRLDEAMWMQMHPMMIADPKSVKPGASLDEIYFGAKFSGKVNWSDPKLSSDVPPGWKRVENNKPWHNQSPEWVQRRFDPAKVFNYSAAKPGFRWADGPSAPSERSSMLGAGWGELPASAQRKHKTKRPKRIGW